MIQQTKCQSQTQAHCFDKGTLDKTHGLSFRISH
jgi:hypothetical protein